MATKAEAAKATRAKKGISTKRARKNAQRKPSPADRRVEPRASKPTPRNKRDSKAVIAAEVAASSPEARAGRDQAKSKRVRSSPHP